MTIATIAHNPHPETIYLSIITILVTTIVLGRLAWASVLVEDDKLRVVNLFSTFSLEWDRIDRFELGRSGILPSVCRVHMKDGSVRSALGISESNFSAAQGLGAAKQMVEELNRELAERVGPRVPPSITEFSR